MNKSNEPDVAEPEAEALSEEALAVIANTDKETLMRWYADMNSWKRPHDFPAEYPVTQCTSMAAGDVDKWKSSASHRYFLAVCEQLSQAEQSWGWWKYAIGETREAWESWWATRSNRK